VSAVAVAGVIPGAMARPFLKWVGGKTQLLPELLRRMPARFGTYYEPFVGAGAMFFALAPERAILNDLNNRLVSTYDGVRDCCEDVIAKLRESASKHSEAYYYERRAEKIDGRGVVAVASWMIYMNKAGFNGLYRVNRSGGFNVPWGKHATFAPDGTNLRACSVALRNVTVSNYDFRKFFEYAQPERGDVVYFDPPYAPLSATSDFDSYTKERFSASDQRDLRDIARSLKASGVHVILSNSSAPLIRDLYADGFTVDEVSARRNVNSNGSGRGAIKELLIT